MLQQAGAFKPAEPAPASPPPLRRQPSRRTKEMKQQPCSKNIASQSQVFFRVGARPQMFGDNSARRKPPQTLFHSWMPAQKVSKPKSGSKIRQNAFKSPQFYIISRRFPFPNLSCAFNPPRKNNCIRVKNPPAPRENLKPITNAAGIRTYFSDSPRHLRASNAPVPAETENSLHRGK